MFRDGTQGARSTTAAPGQPSILLVEDEADMVRVVKTYLTRENFRVTSASTVAQMREILARTTPDLVLLDLLLPDESGWEALRWIRERGSLPVIMLTAQTESTDMVVGLEMGADDYVPKPFVLRELLARIRSVLRRAHPEPTAAPRATREAITFKDWSIDLRRRQMVSGKGEPVHLSDIEYRIIELLALRAYETVSRDHLSMIAAGREWNPSDRSIDVHMSNLRRKLKNVAVGGEIRAVRGEGYMLVPET